MVNAIVDLVTSSDDELPDISNLPYDASSKGSVSMYFTQPTQILDVKTLITPGDSAETSPAHSTVEVPRSSPFRNHDTQVSRPTGHPMAPRGTMFQPPRRPESTTSAPKTIIAQGSNDSSDDELAREEVTLPFPGSGLRNIRGQGTERIFNMHRGRFSREVCARALNLFGNDVLEAAKHLHHPEVFARDYNLPGSNHIPVEEFLPKGWPDVEPEPESIPDSGSEALKTPQKPRRRLIQGRRQQESSPAAPSSPAMALATPQRPVPAVIDLLGDDGEDEEDFVDSQPPSPTGSAVSTSSGRPTVDDRVLSYLNECNVIQLMAITGMKEASTIAMLKHQPFSNLEAARNVSIPGKKKGNKTARVSIGDEVVDSVRSYTRTLDQIDKTIRMCERQAEEIHIVTSAWSLDSVGQRRKPGDSAVSEELPFSCEPGPMQGHCTLKPYQLYGLNWMRLLCKFGFGGILADDMGLGKTCQVVSLISSLVESWENQDGQVKARPWPNLIVVPPSTLENWQNEFDRFAPDLAVTTYSGSQMSRDMMADDILDDPSAHHVILTTYTQLGRSDDIANLRKIGPVVAVFDEGHKLKNPKTKLYKDLSRIDATWRLLLTGTPVQNNLMEMIGLLSFIQPTLFQSQFNDLEALFAQKFSVADLSKGVGLHSDRVTRARTILEPFILQRRKEQVLKDLPAKTRRVVFCDLNKEQKAIYRHYQNSYAKSALESEQEKPAAAKTGRSNDNNNVWMQLRKAAIHPLLFRKFFDDEACEKMAKILLRAVPYDQLRQDNEKHMADELKGCSDFELHLWCRDYRKLLSKFDMAGRPWLHCGKVRELMSLLRKFRDNGDRALVFTQYAKVIEILIECLSSEGFEYEELQGNTDVKERQAKIDNFTTDKSIPVFLLTTKAGGTGINLTAANKVVIFDMSDNPQEDVQAENRAHRIGQTREVEVIRLVSKGTVEETIHKACLKKLELADKVTGWDTPDMDIEAEVREELQQQLAHNGGLGPDEAEEEEPAPEETPTPSKKKRSAKRKNGY